MNVYKNIFYIKMKDNFLTKIVDTNIATALAMIVNLTIWAHLGAWAYCSDASLILIL